MDRVWPIDWRECLANADDVAFAKTEGRKIKVGDALWRTSDGFGPISTDHNHWTGWHLTGEESDIFLAASAPELRSALLGLLEVAELAMPDTFFQTDSRVKAARAALALSEGVGE